MIDTEIHKNFIRLTMTVGEIKQKLEDYPDDMAVILQWDDCYWNLTPECFELDKTGRLIVWAEGWSVVKPITEGIE